MVKPGAINLIKIHPIAHYTLLVSPPASPPQSLTTVFSDQLCMSPFCIQLTSCCRAFLETFIVAQIINKFFALWNSKISVIVHKIPLFHLRLNYINSVSAFTHYLYKIYFNIIFQSTPRSHRWYFPFRF